MTQTGLADLDLDRVEQELYANGITAMRGAHPPELIDRLHEECMRLYEEASTYPGGRVRRGPQRWYFAVHPERLSMVVDLLSHPWLVQTCRRVLGTTTGSARSPSTSPSPVRSTSPGTATSAGRWG